MRIQVALVDHSGLPRFPHYLKACAEMHRQLDPFYRERQILGAAIRPAGYAVLPLGDGLMLIARRPDGLAE